MKKDKTLLIMAAGMGSRFGGLKQIEPLGPNKEFIIDYSIYDAKKYGFNKVVFVIKEENYKIFKETIGNRVEKHIKTEYVFQDFKNVPEKYFNDIKNRVKPLGTAHAVLCAKDVINEPFVVINADDFYGSEAFEIASKTLDNLKTTPPYEYSMIIYNLKNTLSENGALKRGVCKVENNQLIEMKECLVEMVNNEIIATPLDENKPIKMNDDATVSMNFLLFTPSIFLYLEKKFEEFLEKNKNNLDKCEFFIPYVMFEAKDEKYSTVIVEKTKSKWYGITYKEDLDLVKNAIKDLVDKNVYPNNLWND